MINIPPIKPGAPVKAEVIADITKSWKVGQILNATTLRGGDSLSSVLIRSGQFTFEAKTPLPLQTGQDIQLLVKALSQNPAGSQPARLPLLSIITPNLLTETLAAPLAETSTLAATKLRQFIAVQQSFSQIQQFSGNLLADKTFADRLPQPLKTLLNNIQSSLQLNTNNITATQLKQQVLNSGVFLESKLHNQSAIQQKADNSLVNDFKFQLLAIKSELSQLMPVNNSPRLISPQQLNQLQTFIKQVANNLTGARITELADKLVLLLPRLSLVQLSTLPGGQKMDTGIPDELQAFSKLLISTLQQQPNARETLQQQLRFRLMLLDLGQQIDQSVSKLTSLQLQPLSREGDSLILLLFNLIFKDSNERFDIDFRIQQETKKTDQAEESWSITLSFHFKTLGKVQSKILLVDNQVSTVFHTEIQSTADKIKHLLPLLESGFKKAGLNVVKLDVDNRLLKDNIFAANQVRLLDENA